MELRSHRARLLFHVQPRSAKKNCNRAILLFLHAVRFLVLDIARHIRLSLKSGRREYFFKRLSWILPTLSIIFVACSVQEPGSISSHIRIEWATGTELNTAGFNLYRSARAEGPYLKINEQLVPASNDPVVGGKYEFDDPNVVPGTTYYYQLEDVEYSGVATRHGPIVATASGGSNWGVITLVTAGIGLLIGISVIILLMRSRARHRRRMEKMNASRESA